MLTRTIRAAVLCGAVLLGASPIAAAGPFDSGSAGQPAPPPPPPADTAGDYCASTYAPTRTTGRTSDGRALYCVQVKGTDAYVWSYVDYPMPVDPHFDVNAGDRCLYEGDMWHDPGYRKMFCKATPSGERRWQYPQ
ncbi:hypothetical protein [Nocardia wallacei]|uniref:hypothetical protein n=1 Tax=Nocardia wallacei TaxID=480035 RepID=UPI00245611E8|nr:hypothetical protein [Nocardia wallacei]